MKPVPLMGAELAWIKKGKNCNTSRDCDHGAMIDFRFIDYSLFTSLSYMSRN